MTKRKRFDPSELERGRRHEREHVDDESFARIIAEDHLAEDPQYYSHLEACMPQTRGSCPTCKGNPPGMSRGGRVCEVCGDAEPIAVRAKCGHVVYLCRECRENYPSFRLSCGCDAPRSNPPRSVRDATTAEKREYLHQTIDELLYPRHVHRNADVAALHRIAKDTGDLSALRDLLADPTLADDFRWLVPTLMRALHHQVMAASIGQIDEYTGPFFRVRRGR